MANLPRFARAWQRHSTVAHPAPAAAQPTSEPELEILPLAPTTQPFEPNPLPPASPPRESTPWISSPAKKVPSPAASPKFKAIVTNVASPPASPAHKSSDMRHSINPNSYQKTPKPTTPPLSPLALPKSANLTTIQSIIQPEVEKKTAPYKKSVEKLDRQTEYNTGKPSQKQQREAINLTGHNVGVIMEISQCSDKRSGGEVIEKIETEIDVRHGNDEGKTGGKEKNQRATGFPMTPFMNSNFQDVNNSIMYNSSCSGRDPGLHLDFSGKSKDDGAIVDDGEKSKY